MRILSLPALALGACSLLHFQDCPGQSPATHYAHLGNSDIFTLANGQVTQTVILRDSMLEGDILSARPDWFTSFAGKGPGITTDGDYALDMMWTDWIAPGKIFNGDLQLTLTKKDYRFTGYRFDQDTTGGKVLDLYFKPLDPDNTIDLRLEYDLQPGKFYAKRRIGLIDTILHKDWLEKFISRRGEVAEAVQGQNGPIPMIRAESGAAYQPLQQAGADQQESSRIVKKGAFGQPCAVEFSGEGAFFGVEFPAADNDISRIGKDAFFLQCSELIGTVVRKDWVNSQWVVEGLAPAGKVRDWFFDYLPDIRVAPNKPYALYNSWYDLRSPEYPHVEPNHVMNEKNILHIIDLFKTNMIDRYGIHLDAFVLDDGWDTYDGDWILRHTTFPHGMKPIADSLHLLGTTLGMWFGPTGGYSFRMRRINWMKAHGYETVGSTPDDEMMDVAGPKYSALLRERTTAFDRDGVGYFKWDGIQFSSSEPDNGHPVGYHSRRAALESIIAMCDAVRTVNPSTFLNITSGTWLSPWWMKYANQIWMQGEDYGYADAPTINERDDAITYKDEVLYDDLHNQDVWFPISNMMTHGIIKGNLEKLGGDDDPLDRFADDAAMYFGRGVTMYEMYISPDLLTPREWHVLASSLAWARDRFDILQKGDMVGGNPTLGQPYGYVHFKGDSGIVVVRNPVIRATRIEVKLDPDQGLDRMANSLVLERVYPDHWISPDLYGAGSTLDLPLDGFESAVYELYPLTHAQKPLLAGVEYDGDTTQDHAYHFHILRTDSTVRLLNPWVAGALSVGDRPMDLKAIHFDFPRPDSVCAGSSLDFSGASVKTSLRLDNQDILPRWVIFLRPDSAYKGKRYPPITLLVDGKQIKPTTQMQEGLWACYSTVLPTDGPHQLDFSVVSSAKIQNWHGHAEIWLVTQQTQPDLAVRITTLEGITLKPTLPSPMEGHAAKINVNLGAGDLSF